MAKVRPGRPPLDPDDPSTNVHLRLPSKQYDAATARARAERASMPDWIRRTLRDALDLAPKK